MKAYRCSYEGCNQTYSNKYNLRRHVSINHYKVRFTCQICDRKLSSAQGLRDHVYCHTGEKPYACKFPGCTKKYRQGSQLSVHKRKHAKQLGLKDSDFAELKLTWLIKDEIPKIYQVPTSPFAISNVILPPLRAFFDIKV
ncbi:unnamed protein product [Blepharisma stoltei]|uniref:C2H2-type domain-containing protein n=1 Tax=Blepharisma stoltei TaxID=1481888 RepID=A0AAU9JPZ1_9CILI|nr:unnamed protein product [Blepharisma stoltei]